MFASKRSIRKAAIDRGEAKPAEQPKHNNKKITRGREHRIQLIKDDHGFVIKQIIQYSPRKLRHIAMYKEAIADYKAYRLAQEAEEQQAGENDVKGLDMAAVKASAGTQEPTVAVE